MIGILVVNATRNGDQILRRLVTLPWLVSGIKKRYTDL